MKNRFFWRAFLAVFTIGSPRFAQSTEIRVYRLHCSRGVKQGKQFDTFIGTHYWFFLNGGPGKTHVHAQFVSPWRFLGAVPRTNFDRLRYSMRGGPGIAKKQFGPQKGPHGRIYFRW